MTPDDGARPDRASDGILADLILAAVFLTRLPLRADNWGTGDRGAAALAGAMRVFPVVGAGIGLAGGLVFVIGHAIGLGPWISAIAAVAVVVALTGALHEDALADVADGFGGGRDRAAKLEIMRDSSIGAYGALALMLAVAARIAALATLAAPDLALAALIGAAAFSRAAMPVVMHVLEPARSDGVGAGAGRPDRETVYWAAGLAAVIIFALLDPGAALIAIIAAALAVWGGVALARRQIGGFTGDVVGAIGQTSEIVFLVACVGAL